MLNLVLLFASIAAFAGFFGLTLVEARTGTRVLDTPRRALDTYVARTIFLVKHVDWTDFFSHLAGVITARIVHDVAHTSLLIVRFVEHELTRVVRYLRDRHPNLLAPRPSRRPLFAQTIEYLKKTFRLPRAKK